MKEHSEIARCFIDAQAEAEALWIENAQLKARLVRPASFELPLYSGLFTACVVFAVAWQEQEQVEKAGDAAAAAAAAAAAVAAAAAAAAAAAKAVEGMTQTPSDELLDQTKLLVAERRCGTCQPLFVLFFKLRP